MKCIFKRSSQDVMYSNKFVYSGFANYYTEDASIGGTLTLTGCALTFEGEHLNAGRTVAVIAIDEVANVQLTSRICTMQYMIITTNSAIYKFAVYNGKEWVRQIKKSMAQK